jgi:hypothetical protein
MLTPRSQIQGSDMDKESGTDKSQEWGEAVDPSSGQVPGPGDIIATDGSDIAPEPLVGSGATSSLEDDEPEGTIPPCPLWAMKDRRHIQWHLLPAQERHERIRDCVGSGDETIYVIDDGRNHAVVARRVGAVQGECEYCLVGRVPLETYEELKHSRLSPSNAFQSATEITICGVAVAEVVRSSNIFDVDRYESADDIPPEYRPGAAFLNLTESLEIAV